MFSVASLLSVSSFNKPSSVHWIEVWNLQPPQKHIKQQRTEIWWAHKRFIQQTGKASVRLAWFMGAAASIKWSSSTGLISRVCKESVEQRNVANTGQEMVLQREKAYSSLHGTLWWQGYKCKCGRKQVVRCLEGGMQRLSESRAVIEEETGRPTVARSERPKRTGWSMCYMTMEVVALALIGQDLLCSWKATSKNPFLEVKSGISAPLASLNSIFKYIIKMVSPKYLCSSFIGWPKGQSCHKTLPC